MDKGGDLREAMAIVFGPFTVFVILIIGYLASSQTIKNSYPPPTKLVSVSEAKVSVPPIKVSSKPGLDFKAVSIEIFMMAKDSPFADHGKIFIEAEAHTRVRFSFLLAVLTVESDLGKNVGTGNWRDSLSHSDCFKQREAFAKITSKLNLNPDRMPVSKRTWYGSCGGVMGPAQIMPTTWLLYEQELYRISTNRIPNPWDIRDAIFAAAIILRDNGAGHSEMEAALKYLAGPNGTNWQQPELRFYGEKVIALTKKWDGLIKLAARKISKAS